MATLSSIPSETIISAQTKFIGSINTDKPLVIDGSFEGEIKSTSSVCVNATGVVKAKIECQSMQLFGKGDGSIVCQDVLEFGASGEFVGDVVTKSIVMAAGAKLDGNCKIGC